MIKRISRSKIEMSVHDLRSLILQLVITTSIAVTILAVTTTVICMNIYHANKTEKLQQEKYMLEQELIEFEAMYKDSVKCLEQEKADITAEKDAEIETLKSDITRIQEEYIKDIEVKTSERVVSLNTLKRYDYVIEKAPSNGGVNADVIQYMEDICKEKNVNPHLMWAIIEKESGYRAKIDNSQGSGAAGLGQLMPSTGEMYWENVMGHGKNSWSKSMAYDPYINIDIITQIIVRNMSTMQSLYDCINQYSGGGGNSYYSDLKKIAASNGYTMSDSTWRYPY